MPHCQKETHDHTAKSKQERKAKKALVLSRKKAAKQKATEDELEKQKNLKNNLALADGFGEYEVGCEEEKEYVAKFNLNKRSKKHLRIDIRKAQEKKEEEEEERRREEEQEKYRLRQEQEQEQEQEQLRKRLEQEEKEGRCYPASEKQLELELEPPPIVEEYLVYVCQCCHKKFNTTNQFINHSKSKKHRDNARLYEEAGVIVTDVKLRSDFDDDDNDNYEDDGDYEDGNSDYEDGVVNGSNRGSDDDELDDDDNNNDAEDSEEEEYYEEPPKRGNTFSAFAGFGDSDSSSSDSDSSDGENSEDEDENDDQVKELPSDVIGNQEEKENGEDEDDLDLLEEIIYQNRLQDRFYGDYCDDDGGDENENDDDDKATDAVVPIPFDDDQYNPDYYTADENRLVSVQHRLQKRCVHVHVHVYHMLMFWPDFLEVVSCCVSIYCLFLFHARSCSHAHILSIQTRFQGNRTKQYKPRQ